MRITQAIIDRFGGKPYRQKIKAIQRTVGAEQRKAMAEAKRALRRAKRIREAT
jgi:hypothetical protein